LYVQPLASADASGGFRIQEIRGESQPRSIRSIVNARAARPGRAQRWRAVVFLASRDTHPDRRGRCFNLIQDLADGWRLSRDDP